MEWVDLPTLAWKKVESDLAQNRVKQKFSNRAHLSLGFEQDLEIWSIEQYQSTFSNNYTYNESLICEHTAE